MDHLTNLLVAARGGDRDALERFVAESQADVWRLCRYLGDRAVADDLAQETYERALRSLHRYRSEGPARSWLLTIARRVCVDHTRRATRRRARDHRVLLEATAGARDGVLVTPDAGDRVDLDHLLAALDDDRRAAFVLTQVLGLHYDEAAEVLGCPIGTIRSRVARARADLVAMFAVADGAVDGPGDHDTAGTGVGPATGAVDDEPARAVGDGSRAARGRPRPRP